MEMIQMIQDTHIKCIQIFHQKNVAIYREPYAANRVSYVSFVSSHTTPHCDINLTQKSKSRLIPAHNKNIANNSTSSTDTPRTVYNVIHY
jgi:hypothetical protein